VEFYKVTNPELGQQSEAEIALKAQQALLNMGMPAAAKTLTNK